ncbi:MAG: hypothetical protein MUC88_28710, partial [Planctomycetes bacterium]|nr:hypothetical protein [Planctomycetota bacterium]
LDGDGATDVVSSTEGKSRTLYAHWAPPDPADYLTADSWKTEPFPQLAGKEMWMFCLPLDVDGRRGSPCFRFRTRVDVAPNPPKDRFCLDFFTRDAAHRSTNRFKIGHPSKRKNWGGSRKTNTRTSLKLRGPITAR